MKNTILVTGGAGFIGSHLCEKLVENHQVLCLDNFISPNEKNINHLLKDPNFEFIKQDINKPFDLDEAPEAKKFKVHVQGIQEIYHFACPTSAKNFEKLRIKTLLTNSVGTINILELAQKYKARVLLASSSVVYGPRRQDIPYFKEDYLGYVNLNSPRACYDEGKRFAESAMTTYRDFYGLDTKIVRIFRTYGPRMPLFDGQMIADFVLQALTGKDLVIYGDETFLTSLNYVDDIVEGIIKMMNSDETGPINLGDSQEYKLGDVAKKIIDMCGSKSKIKFAKPLTFMNPLGLPDISLAKEKLEWYPLVSLEQGLKKTIDYIERNRLILEPLTSKYEE